MVLIQTIRQIYLNRISVCLKTVYYSMKIDNIFAGIHCQWTTLFFLPNPPPTHTRTDSFKDIGAI